MSGRRLAVAAAFSLWGAAALAQTPSERLAALGDAVARDYLAYDPGLIDLTGVDAPGRDRFADRSPAALADFDARWTRSLAALRAIDRAALSGPDQATYAVLQEMLEADLQLRVCRTELWNVNHFNGWQSNFTQMAAAQPVGSPAARADALKRWGSVPAFLDQEIANLRSGLAQGYAAPKSVVGRVIGQMNDLTSVKPEASPFYSPAERDPDPAFRAAFGKLMVERVNPALIRYRDFLQTEYLPRARDGVAVSELPNGAACYQANLRSVTTLNRTPQEVYDLGRRTVEANAARVIALGRQAYGLTDFAAIVERSKGSAANHFKSKDELLAYNQALMAAAKIKTAALVERMPTQEVVIKPAADFEEAAGVNSRYEPEPDPAKPGVYRIQLGDWATKTRAEAAITAVHEAWPGHHLQFAIAREHAPDTAIAKLTFNGAYMEGWARYSEALAEEAGMYDSDDALIMRRIWPARGMVVDPGLHAFGWTRKQAVDYLVATGRFDARASEDMIDRIAVMPGQLTAYDSGGLEIMALRAQAETALGRGFDLKAFNQVILKDGALPLVELRRRVEAWIAAKSAAQ
ncbi:DUF885 domain-containing protein [Caulobacter mirabilis]|uniref:DUF885 domain-containing protein n=1 Tax=Caulobacter mirabilis TaxID=69666 RepID=A0A2D2AWJ0_9CAUL|nr:DUF885 domain-containing protein [Caulobacter mirabilis]ATQ42366.1 DUF885 domain-containing protein [Caulobacter mirabilis]